MPARWPLASWRLASWRPAAWREVLFPLACAGCGRVGAPVCPSCRSALPAAPGTPRPPGLDAWSAPFAYEGPVRDVVARVKYRGLHAAVAWLAAEMAILVGPPLPEVVTWSPTTEARRRARGFDHAELLARAVAIHLRRPVRVGLDRVDHQPQTGRSARARRVGPVFAPRPLGAGRVLLVDDVATTGATLAAAAAALRAGGATSVVASTAAQTPAP